MADNDIFERTVPPSFRKAYRVAKHDGEPLEVAQQCRPALAKFLHEHQGCPYFDEFCALIEPMFIVAEQRSLNFADYKTIVLRSERLARSCAGSQQAILAQWAAQTCRDLALEAQVCGPLSGDVKQIFAQHWCERIVQVILDRLSNSKEVLERFEIVSQGDEDVAFDALCAWKGEIEKHLPQEIENVARQLAKDPSGQTVRARAVRHPKRSTAELVTGLRLA